MDIRDWTLRRPKSSSNLTWNIRRLGWKSWRTISSLPIIQRAENLKPRRNSKIAWNGSQKSQIKVPIWSQRSKNLRELASSAMFLGSKTSNKWILSIGNLCPKVNFSLFRGRTKMSFLKIPINKFWRMKSSNRSIAMTKVFWVRTKILRQNRK